MSQSWQQYLDSMNPGSQDPTGAPSPTDGSMGPPPPSSTFSSMPNMIQNSDGTWTDTATGAMYDSNGTSLGTMDPQLMDALNSSGSSSGGNPLAGLFSGIPGGATGLLAGLAPLLAGLYSANQTGKATGQVTQGIQNAQTAVSNLLNPTSSGQGVYAPYTTAGANAMTKLGGMNFNPINFGPLGGRPVTLGAIAAPPAASTTKGR